MRTGVCYGCVQGRDSRNFQLSAVNHFILCCRQLSAAEHNVHNVVLYAASVLYLL